MASIGPSANHARITQARILLDQGRAAQARQVLLPIASRSPGDVALNMLMRSVLTRLGEHQQALYYAERAAAAAPDNAQALNLVGNSLVDLGRFDAGAEVLARAMALQPEEVLNHAGLANALGRAGRLAEAEDAARRAVQINPDHPRALGVLASILVHTGQADEATDLFAAILRTNGKDLGTISNLCGAHNYAPASGWLDSLACAGVYGDALSQLMPTGNEPHLNSREPDRRLRLALVAADFRAHASMFFVDPLIDHIDRDRFELYIYHSHTVEDEVSRRVKAAPGLHWLNAAPLSAPALAQRMRADKIDIAVDLSGHTMGHRLAAFHMRCAPVQATWLAYPCTTGVKEIDYRIVDSNTDPAGGDERSWERLWRLDPCFFAYRLPIEAASLPRLGPPPGVGNGFMTFGCFSSAPKINDPLMSAWGAILHEVPGAKLLIKNHALRDDLTRSRFRTRLESRGVPGSSLIIETPAPSAAALLDEYNRVDIALDTFPYTAMTTAAEALLMGVPLVTRAGETSASRGAVPYLRSVGLDDLIATGEKSYIQSAIELAKDQRRLANLRAELRARLLGSVVCDERGWCRRFETALRQMWRAWCDRCAETRSRAI